MNIAEILKYCNKGTKLYSTIFGDVYFQRVRNKDLIEVTSDCGVSHEFLSNGSYSLQGECVLFPSKDLRNWNKFKLPIKRGDIMMDINGQYPFIASGEFTKDGLPKYICILNTFLSVLNVNNKDYCITDFYIPASEEAKKGLFDKIAESGYKWNADTLKLEKIEPKFKEGDVLIKNNTLFLSTGVMINDALQSYCLLADGTFLSCGLSLYSVELASEEDRNKLFSAITKGGYKYDKEQHKLIKHGFKAFDKVLVRDSANEKWLPSIFLFYEDEVNKKYPYVCINGRYGHCIPYEGNEYLLGKTINPYMI